MELKKSLSIKWNFVLSAFCLLVIFNVPFNDSTRPLGTTAALQKVYTKEFGESCNHLEKCNYRHWLKCRDGVCECTNSDGMIFIDTPSKFLSFFSSRSTLMEKKSCRARVESPCNREHFLDDENNFIPAPPLTKPQNWSIPKQTQLCVANAYCHSHGICKCNMHYAGNLRSGLCDKYRGFSESCEREDECHPDQFLKCRRGICQCDPSLRYSEGESTTTAIGAATGTGGDLEAFSTKRKLCGASPGEKCVLRLSLSGKLIHNCQPNATCHLGECKCVQGFEPDYKLKMCVPRGFGSECSDSTPCFNSHHVYSHNYKSYTKREERRKELLCVNSTCVCNGGLALTFNSKMKRCALAQEHNGVDDSGLRVSQLQAVFFKIIPIFLFIFGLI